MADYRFPYAGAPQPGMMEEAQSTMMVGALPRFNLPNVSRQVLQRTTAPINDSLDFTLWVSRNGREGFDAAARLIVEGKSESCPTCTGWQTAKNLAALFKRGLRSGSPNPYNPYNVGLSVYGGSRPTVMV